MKTIIGASPWSLETLEARLQFSGAADLTRCTATLSVPRHVIAADTIVSQALFVGGYSSQTGVDAETRVDIYNATAGAWSNTAVPGVFATAPSTVVGRKGIFSANDGTRSI